MDMKLMISVWSKMDPSSEVGKVAQEKSDEPMVLNIYPGADATFCLYEDDAKRKLTIGKRNGSFEGMKAERTFKAAVAGTERSIRYNGRKSQ